MSVTDACNVRLRIKVLICNLRKLCSSEGVSPFAPTSLSVFQNCEFHANCAAVLHTNRCRAQKNMQQKGRWMQHSL